MAVVEEQLDLAKRKAMMKYEDDGLELHNAFQLHNDQIRGQRGIVVGSEDPWVEALALHYGADELLTVEFGSIHSHHPQLKTMLPRPFTEGFLNGDIPNFDFGISFSSLEHDGMGRYGDILNPIGDLQSMAKQLSVIKPGGLFFVALNGMGVDLESVITTKSFLIS